MDHWKRLIEHQVSGMVSWMLPRYVLYWTDGWMYCYLFVCAPLWVENVLVCWCVTVPSTCINTRPFDGGFVCFLGCGRTLDMMMHSNLQQQVY